MKKTKHTGQWATKTLFTDRSPTWCLDRKACAQIERRLGFHFELCHMEKLSNALSAYAHSCRQKRAIRGSKLDRRRLILVGRHLRALINELSELNEENQILFHVVFGRKELSKFTSPLTGALRQVEQQLQRSRKGPVSRFEDLAALLKTLEPIFKEQSAKSTGVDHYYGVPRHCWYTDFVWQLLLRLPPEMRPRSAEALAATWEQVRARSKPRNTFGRSK